MRKLLSIVVALVVAFTLVSPAVASAQAQNGTPPQPQPPGTFDFPGACPDFDVQFTLDGLGKVIALPGDRTIVTAPGLFVTLTNASNPANSVTLNSTGAFHQSTDANGNLVTVVTGRNILFDPFAGFVLAIGTFSFAFDPDGNLVQPLAGTGQLLDICAMLR